MYLTVFFRVAWLAQGTAHLVLARGEEWKDPAPVAPEKGGSFFLLVALLAQKAPFPDLAGGALPDHGRAGGGTGPGGFLFS